MNSLIYNGFVTHERFYPVKHFFKYPIIFYAIDIDEINLIKKEVKGFNTKLFSPLSLNPSDYLFGEKTFRNQLAPFIKNDDVKKIILITVLRLFVPTFNPVNFYYCLDKNDKPIKILAEVNNTFSERHIYSVKANNSFPIDGFHEKQFHVSPFNNMIGSYKFLFSEPSKNLKIEIDLLQNKKCLIKAKLWGKGEKISTYVLWKTIIKQPFLAISTFPRILIQAGILRFKHKLPIYKKPIPNHKMTIKK